MESVIKIDPPAELKEQGRRRRRGRHPGPRRHRRPGRPVDARAERARARGRRRRRARPSPSRRTPRPSPRAGRHPARRAGARAADGARERRDRPSGGTAPPAGQPASPSARGATVSRSPRRPRPRHRAEAGRAEAPRQLRRLRDPDPRPRDQLDRRPVRRRRLDRDRPAHEVRAVELELDPERLRQLAGPRAEVLAALEPAARAHPLDALERLERADQHRRADALVLADRVEERVDAVGAVDVGAPRRAEEDVRARRQADVGVAGGLGLVVGLGLDDRAGAAVVAHDAADERRARPRPRAARRSAGGERAHPGWASSEARAWASCSRTRGSAVPPSETFDSSHERCSSSV